MADHTKNNPNINSNRKSNHASNSTSNRTSNHASNHNQRNLLLLAVIVLLLLFRVFGNFSEEESSITSDETYVQETYTEDAGTAEASEETAKESQKEPVGEADGEPVKEHIEEEEREQDDDTADLVEAYNEYMQQLQGTQSTQGTQDTRDTQDAQGTSTVRFRNTRLRQEHYEKHGIEMGFPSPEAYEQAAAAVVQNKDALHKLEEEDGDDVYYLESTNEFVIVSTDGYIRTYFYPSNGKDYFDRQ